MMAHRKTTLAYGVTDNPRHKYALEDYSDFSRKDKKARSVHTRKRDLKSKARQASRRMLDNLKKRGNYED